MRLRNISKDSIAWPRVILILAVAGFAGGMIALTAAIRNEPSSVPLVEALLNSSTFVKAGAQVCAGALIILALGICVSSAEILGLLVFLWFIKPVFLTSLVCGAFVFPYVCSIAVGFLTGVAAGSFLFLAAIPIGLLLSRYCLTACSES